MGVVYKAYDLRLRRTVALKFIAPRLALDERFRERFARETELAMALEHPNVVPIHDAGDVDGRLYLAMRLVYSDLRKLLRAEGRLEPARAVAICRQVAGALDAAHSRGLVHRDVKPSNVLLDDNEHVYLADFGLTRRLDEQAPPGTEDRSIGTPAYLAPEQLEGTSADGRADVYALGCVLFECLTSTPPYLRASRLEVAWAHLEEEPPRASIRQPELPEAVDAVVSRAMAKDPAERYETCGALVTAAESALRLRRSARVRRRTALLGAAALVMLVGAGGVAGFIASRSDSRSPPPLYAGVNTVARIDPGTNKVASVIPVGQSPVENAAGGHSVWVYNWGDSSISEIDARTNTVRKPTSVVGRPTDCCSVFAGPVLAADSSGAWFISGRLQHRARLTHLLADGRGSDRYRLEVTPTGVAVGEGYVWVVGRGAHDYEVLKIHPASGTVAGRTRFPASMPIDSIAVGFGNVWVVGTRTGILYRINAQSEKRTGRALLGFPPDTRPVLMRYLGNTVDVGYKTRTPAAHALDGWTVEVAPRSLKISQNGCGCDPALGDADTFSALGSIWWDDWPTSTVSRERVDGVGPEIKINDNPPVRGGPCITSMTFGAGSAWVSVGPSVSRACRLPGHVPTQ